MNFSPRVSSAPHQTPPAHYDNANSLTLAFLRLPIAECGERAANAQRAERRLAVDRETGAVSSAPNPTARERGFTDQAWISFSYQLRRRLRPVRGGGVLAARSLRLTLPRPLRRRTFGASNRWRVRARAQPPGSRPPATVGGPARARLRPARGRRRPLAGPRPGAGLQPRASARPPRGCRARRMNARARAPSRSSRFRLKEKRRPGKQNV
ncbi:uncharacterized protein LOC127571303 [Pristis pectinata]|uniref:uncharacterized protein LOC127571303 n=1 Tax=Pristis pectinata TaxID=685728 RepID=UPI00223D8F0A|nr:uncharacterized protein LOC127571303 [Pristis pectinata]